MRTAEQFWQDLADNPPNLMALQAEGLDLTRRSTERIGATAVFSKIQSELSESGFRIFLAGMYLQGSMLQEARLAYEQLVAEIERRAIERYRSELPQRKGKTNERLARGL